MTMIELVMTVCLLSSPSDCRDEHVRFDGPLFACASRGQLVAVEWLSTHPKWRLERWQCGPPRVRA